MSGLLELAEQCEWALRPDRMLDERIRDHTGYEGYLPTPNYTASIDAAMTLVPGWASPGVSQNVFHQDWHAWIGRENKDAEAVDVANATAATPALALCAAALRARAEQVS